jgi:hypothetical protein
MFAYFLDFKFDVVSASITRRFSQSDFVYLICIKFRAVLEFAQRWIREF